MGERASISPIMICTFRGFKIVFRLTSEFSFSKLNYTMPLVHFAFQENEIPDGALNVQEVTESYRSHFTNPDARLWTWETHHGLCIQESERNGRDDSDFYMLVWNPEKGAPEHILFYTTRGWMYPCQASRPDATPEVLAALKAYNDRIEHSIREKHAKINAGMPAKGKVVRVVKGRNVPIGTTGPVFWANVDQEWILGTLFRRYTGRVGIETPRGRVFTNADNVQVVETHA